MRSDDTRAWFERRLREPPFVIPEISDFRRQRGTARERERAFGNAVLTAQVRQFLSTNTIPVASTNPTPTSSEPSRTRGFGADSQAGRSMADRGARAGNTFGRRRGGWRPDR